ncbi:MAG: gliding motility-associated C-terminal domain-containing protein, partial [Bacteroidales bacterium]|nr:gliding motility-associated C-terminal domain-containing protein [Bacteroidales bacterium]
MKLRELLVLMLLLVTLPGIGQYMSNPSMEGEILMIGPPPDWEICITGSTPNVQPGKYNVYLPPSHGITYVGLLTRANYTWEDMATTLITPLSKDTCYRFQIDLAFQEVLSFTVVDPIILRVYGANVPCFKTNVLWESPPISNLDWETYEFMIHNDGYDLTDIILETWYAGANPYWGYMLLDNIRITPTPIISLGSDTLITQCGSDTLVLDPGPGFYSYLWQDGSTNQTYTVDTTGLYWVQVFNELGCSWTDSIHVIMEEYYDMVSQMPDSTTACEGHEVTLTADIINGAQPFSYQWHNLPDTTQSITVIPDSSMYYTVTVTDKCGITLTDSIKVVLLDSPDIELGNDTLICPDGTLTLIAPGGYTLYEWQDGSNDSVYVVTEPGLYWVEVTSYFGCTARDSINVDLFPPIALDLGNDTILCVGDSVIFFAGGNFVNYLWQDNSSGSSYTAYTTGLYWVTVTDTNGCFATDSVFASFLPPPLVNIGNDTSMCQGDEITLDAGSGYMSYLWQNSSNTQFYTATEGGWYWVTVSNGCGEATDSIFIEEYPAPQPDLGPDTTVCNGEVLILETGSQYVSYLWQDYSTQSYYTVISTGSYSVTVENFYGCFGEDEIYVFISDSQVDLGEDRNICEGDTEVLDAGGEFDTFLWQDNSTGQTFAVTEPGFYSVTVEDDYGCESSDTVTCLYYAYPNPDVVPDQAICEGESAVLEAPAGEFLYFWNGIPGGQNHEVSEAGSYSLTMVNPCDSVTDEIEVIVEPLPEIYIGEDEVLFPGQTIELDAGSGFDEYLWQDGSGNQYFIVTENNIDPNNPYYYVEVTEGICKNSDTIMIELYKVWVPNVITPNGDGHNDTFRPDMERWSGVKQHKMIVFNRWGEKVWESGNFEA